MARAPERTPNGVEQLLPYFLLVALTWVAHFLQFRQFGLYEDDYHYIGMYLDADFAAVRKIVASSLIDWPQGRPLQSIVPPLLTTIAFPIGGLPLLYVMGFGITAASAVLFYRLTLRVTGSPLTAVMGSVTFVLFPADTTHPFLMHAFVLRLAIVCALGASLLYLNQRRSWAYLLAFTGLLLYETPLLIFLSTPLLTVRWHARRDRRELLRHVFLCGTLMAFTVVMRVVNQEARILDAQASLIDILWTLPAQLLTGALTAIRQMTYGAVTRIGADLRTQLLVIMAIPLFYAWLRWASQRRSSPAPECYSPLPPLNAPDQTDRRLVGRLLLASGAMLLIAYILSFTHAAWIIRGRLTSVHMAAAVGGSLLFALVTYSVLVALKHPILRQIATGILAVHFAVLLGYRHSIQLDFARSWILQRWYWTNIVEAIGGHMTESTVVLIDGADMPRSRYIRTYSWFDPLVFEFLFHIPSGWRRPPAALPLFNGTTHLESREGVSSAFFAERPRWYPLLEGNVILVQQSDGRLLRSKAPSATLQGLQVSLRAPVNDPGTELETRPLYNLLIDRGLLQRAGGAD